MRDLGKAGGRRGADPARRAVGADQLGKARLDRGVAAAQLVIIGIGDLRRGFGVIEPVVMANLRGQRGQLGAGLLLGQLIDGRGSGSGAASRGAHARAPAMRLAAAARASAVMVLPDSMRAISSCRVSGSSSSTRVTVARSACCLATRQ